MKILRRLLNNCGKTRIWPLLFAMTMLFVQGCDVVILRSDRCLTDHLITMQPGEVVEESQTELEILIHNAQLEDACPRGDIDD
jgi:hypothetical protein